MRKTAGLIILAAAITISGCTGTTSKEGAKILAKNSITLQGNSSKQIEIQVKNSFENKAASYTVRVAPPDIVDVLDSGTGEEIKRLKMGEAKAGSKTVKKVLTVRGNPEALGNLSSGTDYIKFLAVTQGSEKMSESQKYTVHDMEVKVMKQ